MSEIDQLRAFIKDEFTNTNSIIESVEKKVTEVVKQVDVHTTRINQLEDFSVADNRRLNTMEYQIELLNQDRLRNNLRLTGLPPIAYERVDNTVMQIIKVLNINLFPSEFTAYSDNKNYCIIVAFDHLSHKRQFMDTLRQRNQLLVEEVFPSIRSNEKIFCNDQLTPYFSQLFRRAWEAKKAKQIHSASSIGGRVKIRTKPNGNLITIESIEHLNEIISSNTSMETTTDHNNGSPRSDQPQQQNLNSQISQENPPIAHNSTISTEPPQSNRNSVAQQSTTDLNTRRPLAHNSASNRENQWSQLRNKTNPRHQHHNRQNYRNQHQDNRRALSVSPNQYHQRNNWSKGQRFDSNQYNRFSHRNNRS